MKQCGIYIIKNSINDKVYIGQSVDIEMRWYAHQQSAKREKTKDGNTLIHRAIREIGIENFYLEILELCDYQELSDREIYWIEKYNSYENGYNMTKGGEGCIGESNGRALLTEDMVKEIRAAYGSRIPFREVHKKYKNIITKRGLQKVWHCETWKNIMTEVYTEENRRWHTTYAKANADGNTHLGFNNQQRSCSNDEIERMRQLRKEGLSYKKIGEIVKRNSGIVRKYCLFQECNNAKKVRGIKIKNVETGLIFDTQADAARWAMCDHRKISYARDTEKSVGVVPFTNEPAHWVSV